MTDDETQVDTAQMIPIDQIARAGIEHADEVVELAKGARDYLNGMPWCAGIEKGWLDFSYGYILCVFYFEIAPAGPDVPHFVWIINGDIPPAYMDGEFHRTDMDALESYVDEMQEWVDRVLDGRPIDDDVITVNVPPEKQWAEQLQTRLNLIRELFLEEQEGAEVSD